MSTLYKNIIFPAWHWLKRSGLGPAISELSRNQWLCAEELASIQNMRLSALLEHASGTVPYYRERLRDLGSLGHEFEPRETLERLPLLTKPIIRREQQHLISSDVAREQLMPNSTSGSTGEALFFYTDRRSKAFRSAAMVRGDSWSGWRPGERIVRLWGAPMDDKKHNSIRGKLRGQIAGERFLSSFDLSAKNLDTYIKIIRTFEPVLLVSYPGPLEVFADHCRSRDAHFPSIRAIITSAEKLWPHQKDLIEEVFGVGVFNRYGSREMGHIASECERHEGLHVNSDRVLLEIINESGRSCAPGETGKIVLTDLDNYGMPLIRYDIGDLGSWAVNPVCSCGRQLPLLESVEGRSMDVIRTPDGHRVGGTFWTLLLRTFGVIRQFQIVQDRIDEILVKFIADRELMESEKSYFLSKIKETCGKGISVQFCRVEEIGETPSGKKRFILSNIGKKP